MLQTRCLDPKGSRRTAYPLTARRLQAPTQPRLGTLTHARRPRAEERTNEKRSQMGTFGYQSSLKSVRHGGSSAQKASSRPECLRVNVSAFELASRPPPCRRLHAVRASAERCLDASSSGCSTRSLPLPPPPSSGVAVPSPPSPGCAALFFASFYI